MSPRERLLAMSILSAVVLAGAAFLFHSLVLGPLQETDNEIARLKKENGQKATRISEVLADRPKLERWRQLSLPADPDLARREYEKYLHTLFRQNGAATNLVITARAADRGPTLVGKRPVYTKLSFNVTAHATLSSFVRVLEKFYRTGLLQQIKTLSVQKAAAGAQATPGELDITLTIEALCLDGAERRTTLLPIVDGRLLALDVLSGLRGGPTGLAGLAFVVGPAGPGAPGNLAEAARNYAAIAGKNVFLGNATATGGVDVAQLVFLTDITVSGDAREANLHNLDSKTRVPLDAANTIFRILSGGEVRVEGTIVRIADRDVYFRSGERYYAIKLGQNLADAMKKPLTPEEVKALKKPSALDKPGP